MNRHMRLSIGILCLFVILLSTFGCGAFQSLPFFATATFYPTYTLIPTYTLVPTYTKVPTYTPLPPTATPIPDTWSVKVISAIKSLTFDGFSYNANQKAEFLIVTIEYTYNGQDTTEFSPMSVAIIYPDGSTYPGVTMVAGLYQPENSNSAADFSKVLPTVSNITPGQTKTEKFAWALNAMGDTKFTLLFPDTKPIDIVVSNIQ